MLRDGCDRLGKNKGFFAMIVNIKNKRLKRLFEDGDSRDLPTEHVTKIEMILDHLQASVTIDDMDLSGFRLHRLKGNYKDYHSVVVRGNWRIIFRFDEDDGDAYDVDYLDYHGK